ncbi:MAG: LysE family translocator [Bryobacteraceae bacterium]
MIDGQVLAYTAMAAVLTLIPGADTMLVVRSVLARGAVAGMLTTLGICAGCLVQGTLSAFGLSAVLTRSAAMFEGVKLAGAVYLMYLGVQSLRAARNAASFEVGSSRGRSFAEGLTTNLLNPKVSLFYLAVLPQFLSPSDGFGKALLLAAIHAVLGLLWLSAVSVFLGRLRSWLLRPRLRQWLEGVTGAMMIGLGVRLAFSRR